MVCVLSVLTQVQAQDFNHYEPLRQSGRFPIEFSKKSSEKFQEQLNQVDGKKRYERKAQEKFYLESNFLIDEMLHSGKILFNDPISAYLNEIGDKLLKNDPKLRKEIQFYTVRSSVVNAFATQNGLIFVTMGLLSQLENEAQLAYILSHEIMHYKLKHGISSAVTKEALRRGKKDYGRLNWDERLEAKSMFNKEQELESDIEGLKLYLSTDYGTQYILNTFDVLQYSYLPYDEVRLDHNFIGSDKLVFPEDYYLEEVTAISDPEKLDEKYKSSTHPDIGKRREMILEELDKKNNDKGKSYLISEKTFERVRNMARFEILPLFNLDSEFEKALYHAFLLQKDFPQSQFVKIEAAKALYMLSLYANNKKFVSVHTVYDDVEGESQQIYHLFEKMDGEEINIAALHFVDRALKQHPSNAELLRYRKLLTQELAYEHYTSEESLAEALVAKERVEVKEEEAEEEKKPGRNSKYAKIRKRGDVSIRKGFEHIVPVLTEFSKEDWFNTVFKEAVKNPRPAPYNPTYKERRAYERHIRRKGRSLGIDKVAIVNTMYHKVDTRKKDKVQYLEGEEAHENFNQKLVQIAHQAGVEAEVIGGRAYKADEADKLADQVLLQQWLTQRGQFNDLENMDYINLDSVKVNSLVEKYGTKYFAWSGRISYADKNRQLLYQLLGSAVFYPAAPFWLPRAFSANHETLEIMLVFDITDGRLLMSHTQAFEHRDTEQLMNSHLYDLFYQIKKK